MNFSHQEYSSILEAFEGRWCSFFDVSDQPFVLMRHDVEFSVERAFELGELENQKGVKSTFNFQVCCDTYNVASNVSRKKNTVSSKFWTHDRASLLRKPH